MLGDREDRHAGSRRTTAPGPTRVVKRIAAHDKGQGLDHGVSADHLRRNQTRGPRLSDETVERFERLFEWLNATLD